MTTISRSRRGRGPYSRFIIIGAILLFGAGVFFFRDTLTSLIWRGAAPAASARSGFFGALGGIGAQFSSKAALEAENDRLREALASSSAVALDRNILYQENLDLKARLGRNIELGTLLGAILLRPPGTPYDTLIIDVGLQDGVREGDRVFAGGSAVLGHVSEVFRTTARVTLLSAPGVSHDASLLLAGEQVPIVVEGQGGGSMRAEVPAGTAVTVGNEIVFSGVALAFVGTVSHVAHTEGSSFTTVYTHLPVNLFELRFVEIGRVPPQQ